MNTLDERWQKFQIHFNQEKTIGVTLFCPSTMSQMIKEKVKEKLQCFQRPQFQISSVKQKIILCQKINKIYLPKFNTWKAKLLTQKSRKVNNMKSKENFYSMKLLKIRFKAIWIYLVKL